MKKTLIWHNFELLERAGGPSTYLYQLKQVIDPAIVDFFQANTSPTEDSGTNETTTSFWKRIIPRTLKHILRINQNLRTEIQELKAIPKNLSIDFNQYKAIHFHRTADLYQVLPLLESYHGKVILTSHTPTAPWLEKMGSVISTAFIAPSTKKAFQEIDRKALDRANILLFPCEEALEPYIQDWKNFRIAVSHKEMYYIPTGTSAAPVVRSRAEIRAELNIPEDAFVVNYFGRHNEIKGYDFLKEMGKLVLQRNQSFYFLIAGKESPLKGLDDPRWIEIGWTTDPFSYLNAADLFVLPNKQTYFDLVLLEVLSVGTPCLITNNGGNRHFIKHRSNDITFFEYGNVRGGVLSIEQISKKPKSNSPQLKQIFEENYTVEIFGKKYSEFYKSLPE